MATDGREPQPFEIGLEEHAFFHSSPPYRQTSRSKWSTRLGHTRESGAEVWPRLSPEKGSDRLVAVKSQTCGLLHGGGDLLQGMILEEHEDPDIFPGAGTAFPAFPQLPVISLIDRRQRPLQDRRGPGEGAGLLQQDRQVVVRIQDLFLPAVAADMGGNAPGPGRPSSTRKT